MVCAQLGPSVEMKDCTTEQCAPCRKLTACSGGRVFSLVSALKKGELEPILLMAICSGSRFDPPPPTSDDFPSDSG